MKAPALILIAFLSTAPFVKAQLQFTPGSGGDTVSGYTGPPWTVVIPSTNNGLKVTSIGNGAFLNSTNLSSITIPATVTSLGNTAFQSCSGLTSITIPAGVTSLGTETFLYCTNLTNVTLPIGLTNLGANAFGGCSGLRSIAIPTGVTSIPFETFNYCSSLANVTIPQNVTNLEEYSFAYCTNLAGMFFMGNAPSFNSAALQGDENTTVYYLAGTTGWSNEFDGIKTVLWNPSTRSFGTRFGASQNAFGFELGGSTNIPVVIEASASLGDPNWLVLQSCTLTNGLITVSDTAWTNYSSRFYRIRSP